MCPLPVGEGEASEIGCAWVGLRCWQIAGVCGIEVGTVISRVRERSSRNDGQPCAVGRIRAGLTASAACGAAGGGATRAPRHVDPSPQMCHELPRAARRGAASTAAGAVASAVALLARGGGLVVRRPWPASVGACSWKLALRCLGQHGGGTRAREWSVKDFVGHTVIVDGFRSECSTALTERRATGGLRW